MRTNLGHSSLLFIELLHHLLALVLEENCEREIQVSEAAGRREGEEREGREGGRS